RRPRARARPTTRGPPARAGPATTVARAPERARSSRRRNPDGRMPLREHIRELRTRVLWSALGIVVGAVGGWFVYPWLVDVLQAPLVDLAARRGELVALNFAGVAA